MKIFLVTLLVFSFFSSIFAETAEDKDPVQPITNEDIFSQLQKHQADSTILGINSITFGIATLIISISIASIIFEVTRKHTKEIHNDSKKFVKLTNLLHDGNFYYNTGDYKNAKKQYDRYLEIQPDDTTVLHNLGATLEQLERWEEAVELYERTIQIDPNNAGLRNNLGLAYEQIGRPYDAAITYYRGLEIDFSHGDILNNIGKLYAEKFDNHEMAFSFYDRVINEKLYDGPEDLAQAIFNKAIDFRLRGNYPKALELLNEALVHDKNNEKTLTEKTNTLYNLQQFGEAIQCANIVLKIYPKSDNVLLAKANALMDSGLLLDSIRATNEYILRNPMNYQAYHNIGVALVKFGYTGLAQIFFEQATTLNPQSVDSHFNLGTGYLLLGMPEPALSPLERAYELDPTNFDVNGNLAECLRRQRQWERAFQFYFNAFKINPFSPFILEAMSHVLETLGQRRLAIDCLQLSLDVEDLEDS